MANRKGTDVPFEPELKETFAQRLRLLIGDKTVRAAAVRWGIPYSTLHNYLTRGNEPSINLAIRIADMENVSVRWLAGIDQNRDFNVGEKTQNRTDDIEKKEANPAWTTWEAISRSLNSNDLSMVVELFLQVGIRGISMMSKEFSSEAVQQFISLSEAEREQVLRLYEQVKRGTDQDGANVESNDPASRQSGAA